MDVTVAQQLLANIIVAVTAVILAVTAFIYWRIMREGVRTSIREATQSVYIEWWSDELHALRSYFYAEVLVLHRSKLTGKGMKEIEAVIPEDKGRIRRLCYFFDRVGWMGAAGLIDVDYILGPMQHVMRRVWITMEPLIQRERQTQSWGGLDPVYQFGFQWLFKRSAKNHQASLVSKRFRRPPLLSTQQSRELLARIYADEKEFHENLQNPTNEQVIRKLAGWRE